MDVNFVWQDSPANSSSSASAEEKIRRDLLGPHSPIQFCHSGAGLVTLAPSDPLVTKLIGNVKCSCGKSVGIIEGTMSASTITLRSLAAGSSQG